jgi:hypothetical protein
MARGGHRAGAGRKPGSVNKASMRAREEAAKTGELPHEFLLRISRGEEINSHTPSFAERMDAAKAAAPYFAARLSTTVIDATVNGERKRSADEMTDEELMSIVGADQTSD